MLLKSSKAQALSASRQGGGKAPQGARHIYYKQDYSRLLYFPSAK